MTSSPIIRANFNGLTSILIKDLFLKKLITKGIKNVAVEARSEHCSSFVGFVVKLRKNDFNLGGHVGEFKWLERIQRFGCTRIVGKADCTQERHIFIKGLSGGCFILINK